MSLQKRTDDYIYGIDLVRFLSALSVAAFHLSYKTAGISRLMPFGWVGVEVFFIISGLVIAGSAYRTSARHFAIHRFLRLYPGAWCCAAISCAVILLVRHPSGLTASIVLKGLLLVPHWKGAIASAYWTLPVEIAFYSLIFVLVRAHRFDDSIHRISVFLILWSAPYAILLALQSAGLVHWHWIDLNYGPKNMLLVRHAMYFGCGMQIWLWKARQFKPSGPFWIALALLEGIPEIYARSIEIVNTMNGVKVPSVSPLWLALSACAVFLAAFGAIWVSVRFNRLFPPDTRVRSIVRALGLATYPLYLLHETVGGAAVKLTGGWGFSQLGRVFFAIALVTAISILVSMYPEPFLRHRIRNRIERPSGRQPLPQPSPAPLEESCPDPVANASGSL